MFPSSMGDWVKKLKSRFPLLDLMLSSTGDRARKLVTDNLTDGEQILWFGGTAKSRLIFSRATLQSMIPIIMGLFIFVLGCGLLALIPAGGGGVPWDGVLVMMLLCLVGIGGSYYARRNRWFALTNHRAFFVECSGSDDKVKHIDLTETRRISILTYPDGVGTIAF